MTSTWRIITFLTAVLFVGLGVLGWRAASRQMLQPPVSNATTEFDAKRATEAPPTASDVRKRPVRSATPEPADAQRVRNDVHAAPSAKSRFDDDARLADRRVETLLSRLSSDDPHLVLDAADGLRARRAVEAIPKLAALDVAQSPDSARSVIEALGELAGLADPANQQIGTDRLLALLEQEKGRDVPDAPGNVLQIYEALGNTAHSRATTALERELSDRSVPLAALTVVAGSLARLGRRSSVTPLAGARDRVAALSCDDEFACAVRKDVVAAIDAAMVSLRARQGASGG